MKLIVGLGNPGKKYEKSRHNIGFMVLGRLASDRKWSKSKGGKLFYLWYRTESGKKIELMKPDSYMNKSGFSVGYVKKKHSELKLDDIYVVHDDLDIELGSYKIQLGRGPRQHNGLRSIYEQLGSKDFWHVRIGVENRLVKGSGAISGEKYVLQKFKKNEQEIIEKVIAAVSLEVNRHLQRNLKKSD